jgi:hypothetical protein
MKVVHLGMQANHKNKADAAGINSRVTLSNQSGVEEHSQKDKNDTGSALGSNQVIQT